MKAAFDNPKIENKKSVRGGFMHDLLSSLAQGILENNLNMEVSLMIMSSTCLQMIVVSLLLMNNNIDLFLKLVKDRRFIILIKIKIVDADVVEVVEQDAT